MKYSLRSLMIGITLLCVALGGRIEYLRRMAAYHEREAHRCAVLVKEQVGYDPEAPTFFSASTGAIHLCEGQYWAHLRLAREYRSSAFRPWTTVKAPPPPVNNEQMLEQFRSLP
jgi:hypothetical protein